jgi:hypothetical protein
MTIKSNNEKLVLKTKELIDNKKLEEIANYLLTDEQDPTDQEFIDIPTLVNETPPELLAPLLNQIRSSKLFYDNIDRALAHFVPRIIQLKIDDQKIIFQRLFLNVELTEHFQFGYVGVRKTRKIDGFEDDNKNIFLDRGEFGIAHKLYRLKIKAQTLYKPEKLETMKAYDAAEKLHEKLSQYFLTYLQSNRDVKAYNLFKNTWDKAIKKHKPTLEKHRGWKNFLANLALFIVTITLVHTGAVIAGKHGLFALTKTDSAKHVDDLEQSIKKLEPK